MKNVQTITITLDRAIGVDVWQAGIMIIYREPETPAERFQVRGYELMAVINRCQNSIDRKLKQNETEAVA